MYARNNASPRPITIGAVVQISDGAVQTTGVSVKVRKDAGSWATGAGTLAVEEGVWSYTPTQSETDCDALQILIFKTGCIPQSMEVVTTSSSSFGYAGTDQSKIANASSTVSLSGTSIKTATDVETKIDAIDDYIDTEIAAIKAKTDNLPSDPADASDIAASFATVNNNLSSIAGYIDTEVAAIKAKTDNLPANPAAVSDIPTANQNRDAVLNADPNAGYTDGSFGDRLLISDNNNRTVKVIGAGAGHVAADVHELQPAVINNTHFAAGAIDANAIAADAIGASELAADAVTEIGVGVWVSAGYAAAIRSAVGMAAADLDTQLDALPADVWNSGSAPTSIRAAMGLASANLDSQLAAALVLQKLAASGATGSVQVTDNGNGTATLVFKDTNGSTTLATVTYNYTSGARTRVS